MNQKISKIWAKNFTTKRELPDGFYLYLSDIVKKYILNGISKAKSKWLDIGCGDGRILIPLSIQCPVKFFGVDINSKMINDMRAYLKRHGINNVIVKYHSGEHYLNRLKKFCVISFFQSIHFFKYKNILKKACDRLTYDGCIIIATTTHNQFKSIPYSKSSVIYKIEIKRTPNWIDIVKTLRYHNLKLRSSKTFSITRKFKDSNGLKNYLEAIPYSAFGIIKSSLRKKIISKIVSNYKYKRNFDFIIDKFKVGIFKK